MLSPPAYLSVTIQIHQVCCDFPPLFVLHSDILHSLMPQALVIYMRSLFFCDDIALIITCSFASVAVMYYSKALSQLLCSVNYMDPLP